MCATACLFALNGLAQWDSLYYAGPATGMVAYHGGFDFHEGVYFTFRDFRNNAPVITMDRLLDAQGRPVTDLRSTNGRLQYRDASGAPLRLDMDRLWGFCDEDVVYVRSGNGFNRIGLMGSLAHLVFDATYRDLGWYDPMWGGMGPTSYTVQEQRLLDMRTGDFLPVNAAGMHKALEADPALRAEFDALPRRTRDRQATVFQFLRRYNDGHPLLFPR